MTPRKFFALVESHQRAEGGEEYQKKNNSDNTPKLTLEELRAWQT